MDYFLKKTWVFQASAQDNRNTVTGGALCISRDGLILTVSHNLKVLNTQLNDCTFMARKSDDTDFRALQFLHESTNFDLALLRVANLEEGEEFDFYPVEDEDGVEVKINEDVFAYVHQNNLLFTEKYGYTCYPFPSNASNNFPDLSDETTLKLAGFPDEKTRTDQPYRTLDIVAGPKDDAFEDMHPKLPFVQVAEFGDEAGSSGCPFFRLEDQKLLGLCSISKHTFQYLLPFDLLKAYVQFAQP